MESGLSLQTRRALLQQMIPQYRQATTVKKKSKLLDAFTATIGYNRKYALWLLNHAKVEHSIPQHTRPSHYGPEVQHALFLVWHTANRICTKRLMPFLPTLVEALERHGHLHLTEECRRQLLSMSAATADRLLRSQRKGGQGGLSTTRAGTLLKQQIPIRTFAEWNEARPGFLEADLVAHCGTDIEGGYLYTLTLTDIATGWTECLPLMHRSREAVLAALQRARTLLPFPMLGIDTDNGGEFINEVVIAYCEQEQITFTRGRPYQKRDQCFIAIHGNQIAGQPGKIVVLDAAFGPAAIECVAQKYSRYRKRCRGTSQQVPRYQLPPKLQLSGFFLMRGSCRARNGSLVPWQCQSFSTNRRGRFLQGHSICRTGSAAAVGRRARGRRFYTDATTG